MSKLYLICIPGLGDSRVKGQKLAVSTWRVWGVKVELFQMNWAKGNWQSKFEKLLKRIDELETAGYSVGLVGASAGASAVINAYAARASIVGCVLISGKVNRPESLGSWHDRHNPAFLTSLKQCQESLEKLDSRARSKIMSRYALRDKIVRKPDSVIPGAVNRTLLSVGHVFTIATQITLGAPFFIHFLQKLNKA